ncbi:hypothetical protein, partial [Actinomadura sp. HBU206391]|uniref:hypothetical protein n=1 Tax=Actinomadura sp. HBU206391 TaxID=2731692 RepID=UPI001C9D46EB
MAMITRKRGSEIAPESHSPCSATTADLGVRPGGTRGGLLTRGITRSLPGPCEGTAPSHIAVTGYNGYMFREFPYVRFMFVINNAALRLNKNGILF